MKKFTAISTAVIGPSVGEMLVAWWSARMKRESTHRQRPVMRVPNDGAGWCLWCIDGSLDRFAV